MTYTNEELHMINDIFNGESKIKIKSTGTQKLRGRYNMEKGLELLSEYRTAKQVFTTATPGNRIYMQEGLTKARDAFHEHLDRLEGEAWEVVKNEYLATI